MLTGLFCLRYNYNQENYHLHLDRYYDCVVWLNLQGFEGFGKGCSMFW